MGKAAKLKQREAQRQEEAFQARFAAASRQAAFVPPAPPLLEHIAPYLHRAVRSPDTFVLKTRSGHRDKQVLELARHVFGRFRIPRVLEGTWSHYVPREIPRPPANPGPFPPRQEASNPNFARIDFRAWFVCAATGGSLHKEHAKHLLSRRETHLFLATATPGIDPCQGVVLAVARAAGAPDALALRLARSRLAHMPLDDFWLDAVRFFCLPGNIPDRPAQVNDLVDYLGHRRAQDPGFRLLGSGHSLPALARRMEQWHRALGRSRALAGLRWEGCGLPDHAIPMERGDKLEGTWHFHQILTGDELAAEGTAQRHCVLSYKHRCQSGDCSIWSLSWEDPHAPKRTRKLTIELDSAGRIRQKRGLANRSPRPAEAHAVARWAQAFGLSDGQGW